MRLFIYYVFIIVVTLVVIFLIRYCISGTDDTLYDNANNTPPILEPSWQEEEKQPIAVLSPPKHEQLSIIDALNDKVLGILSKKNFCLKDVFENKSYIVCRANPDHDKIELFLNDENNEPFKRFYRLENALNAQEKTIAFAMNAGMYHADYAAVGLYVENNRELYPISTKDGSGNFHMKPNGVFFIYNGKAGVLDTNSFIALDIKPQLATQSGPMLVINNVLHKRFIPQSSFLEYRNGVGVTDRGEVIFVLSEEKVNFDEMARFFRDKLKTPNALYFDGSISSIYMPELGRKDWWYALGPIIAVVVDKEE